MTETSENKLSETEWTIPDHFSVNGQDAATIFSRLLTSYAVREDNTHVGSGLGGNYSMLTFLLLRKIKLVDCNWGYERERMTEIVDDPATNTLTISFPHIVFQEKDKIDIRTLRLQLETVVPPSSVKKVSKEEIINPSFWTDQGIKSNVVNLIISTLKLTEDFMKTFPEKKKVIDQAREIYDRANHELQKEFVSGELGLTEENDDDWLDFGNLMMLREPFSERSKKISADFSTACLSTITPKDQKFLDRFEALPTFLALMSLGTKVGIATILDLCLDQVPQIKKTMERVADAMERKSDKIETQ